MTYVSPASLRPRASGESAATFRSRWIMFTAPLWRASRSRSRASGSGAHSEASEVHGRESVVERRGTEALMDEPGPDQGAEAQSLASGHRVRCRRGTVAGAVNQAPRWRNFALSPAFNGGHRTRESPHGAGRAVPDGINREKRWRKRWDSNPRTGFPVAGFQDRFLKPLGHSS